MATEPGRTEKTAALKRIIADLHGGQSIREARQRFERDIGAISPSEIAELEQDLIDDGMPPEVIKQFCNLHVLLFESALGKAPHEETSPHHPIAFFRAENVEIERRLADIQETVSDTTSLEKSDDLKLKLLAQLLDLMDIETHYARKESVLLPHLEKVGLAGPSKVMSGKDNDIRALLESALDVLKVVGKSVSAHSYVADTLDPLLEEIKGMVFKEENILFPTALEKLEPRLWVEILKESDEVGYAFIDRPAATEELIRRLRETAP